MDYKTKTLLDSLDQRIEHLENDMPRLAKQRSVDYYYKRQELDKTKFIKDFEKYVFDEDLDKAILLLDSKLKSAQKRNDRKLIKFYQDYQTRLTFERSEQRRKYQELFAKEKTFRKELFLFIEAGDDYSLKRAERMVELAIKFAEENSFKTVLDYLYVYRDYVQAVIFDKKSDFDLPLLTKKKKAFESTFISLIESDSLESVMKGKELVYHCYTYSISANTKIDSAYFAKQRIIAANAISDWYDRQGLIAKLSELTDHSVIARRDSINPEGIYKWHEYIVVISAVSPKGNYENVRIGEAIIDADRKILNYLRLNRMAKVDKGLDMGKTTMIPYILDDKKSYFIKTNEVGKWQYMVCYKMIISPEFMVDFRKRLPPIQFFEEANQTASATAQK